MTRYLGVTAVRAKGTMIEERSFSPKADQPPVPKGKRLVAICRNAAWEVAPDVTDPSDYRELCETQEEGLYDSYDLYLLDETEVPACPDEGRHFLT